jgi:hypothetical protein
MLADQCWEGTGSRRNTFRKEKFECPHRMCSGQKVSPSRVFSRSKFHRPHAAAVPPPQFLRTCKKRDEFHSAGPQLQNPATAHNNSEGRSEPSTAFASSRVRIVLEGLLIECLTSKREKIGFVQCNLWLSVHGNL